MTPRDILGSDLLSWRHLAPGCTEYIELVPAKVIHETPADEGEDDHLDPIGP